MNIANLIIGIIILFVVYLLLRPVFLWYWKVDKIEDLLREQTSILQIVHKEQLLQHEKHLKEVAEERAKGNYSLEGVVLNIPGELGEEARETIIRKAKLLKAGEVLTMNEFQRYDTWSAVKFKEHVAKGNYYKLKVVASREDI